MGENLLDSPRKRKPGSRVQASLNLLLWAGCCVGLYYFDLRFQHIFHKPIDQCQALMCCQDAPPRRTGRCLRSTSKSISGGGSYQSSISSANCFAEIPRVANGEWW